MESSADGEVVSPLAAVETLAAPPNAAVVADGIFQQLESAAKTGDLATVTKLIENGAASIAAVGHPYTTPPTLHKLPARRLLMSCCARALTSMR